MVKNRCSACAHHAVDGYLETGTIKVPSAVRAGVLTVRGF